MVRDFTQVALFDTVAAGEKVFWKNCAGSRYSTGLRPYLNRIGRYLAL